MTGIEVRELCVRFGDHEPVLDGLSLSVAPGEIVALLGGSGSGKSTLLRAIAQLQPIASGEVAFTCEESRRQGGLSYVFQDATLLPWRTALENVQLPLELARRSSSKSLGGDAVAARVREALAAVGLPQASWTKYPRQLSGGMRMRVSLARAIVTDPAILLLDEPFGALDEILRGRMNDLLVELWTRRRRTVLFVTHNIAEAINLS
ncbi:MAG: ABC transporter ATP-binding protein, partial [Aureliella sp.]